MLITSSQHAKKLIFRADYRSVPGYASYREIGNILVTAFNRIIPFESYPVDLYKLGEIELDNLASTPIPLKSIEQEEMRGVFTNRLILWNLLSTPFPVFRLTAELMEAFEQTKMPHQLAVEQCFATHGVILVPLKNSDNLRAILFSRYCDVVFLAAIGHENGEYWNGTGQFMINQTPSETFNLPSVGYWYSVAYQIFLYKQLYQEKKEVVGRTKIAKNQIKHSKKRAILNPIVIGEGFVTKREGATDPFTTKPISLVTHWRSGHWRNQPYGEKNSKSKLIWIEPVLVHQNNGLEAPSF